MGIDARRYESPNFVVLYDDNRWFAASRSRIAEQTLSEFTETFTDLGFELPTLTSRLVLVVWAERTAYLTFAERIGYDARNTDAFYSFAENVVVLFDASHDPNALALRRRIEEQQAGVRRLQDQLGRIEGPPETIIQLEFPGQPPRRTTRRELARELSRDNALIRDLEERLGQLAVRQNAAKTRHEVAHQLAVSFGIQPAGPFHPLWVSEGLACQFEVPLTASARDRKAVNRARWGDFRSAARRARLLPLETLLAATSTSRLSSSQSVSLYAQSWGLFHYLRVERPDELRAYLRDLPRGPATDEDPAARFAAHFGGDLFEIEQTYTDYLVNRR